MERRFLGTTSSLTKKEREKVSGDELKYDGHTHVISPPLVLSWKWIGQIDVDQENAGVSCSLPSGDIIIPVFLFVYSCVIVTNLHLFLGRKKGGISQGNPKSTQEEEMACWDPREQ